MDLIYFGRDCEPIECDVIYQYVLKIDGKKANGERVGVEMATDSAGYAAGRS